jgi:4-amino-4-deoxy-L-arabinose transferase-like glycosyltransferase
MFKNIINGILLISSIFIIIYFLVLNKVLFIIFYQLITIFISGDYNPNFSNINWWYILLTVIGAGIYIVIGIPVIKLVKSKPKLPFISLAFIIGLGIVTFIFEIFAIFFLLDRIVIIITFLIISIGGWLLLSKRKQNKTDYFNNEESLEFKSIWKKMVYWICLIIITLITILTFYHALCYPETYWDSLIYYLHYGKMISQQHGFPVLVCAQVGLGLGANYPHLYPLLIGTVSILFGGYNDIFGQFFTPFAGLLATILIYYLTKLMYAEDKQYAKLIAISTALIFRSVPLGIAYFTYASDYAMVMLFTTGFLYTAYLYLKNKQIGYLWLTGLITAFQTQINYLGWIFFPLLLLLVIFSKERIRTVIPLFSIAMLISLPWYIRNWLVTGNPVYAFFPQIFGGKHINPEVLASCYKEWTANGIGVPGATGLERILNAPHFFFYDWRFAPALLSLTIPGIIIGLFNQQKASSERANLYKQIFYLTLALFGLGFFYHLIISPLYLYQIIFIIPAMAILSGYFLYSLVGAEKIQPLPDKARNWIKGVIFGLVMLVGLVPGLAMSIMGHKIANTNLIAFRYPGMEKMQFMELVYGDAVPIWEWINGHLHNTKLLTHDNRYQMYNDDIQIIHLDDWDVQPLYKVSDIKEKLTRLKQLGIEYYFFIPNERNHPIVAKLGLAELITTGYLKEIYSVGEHKLYQFDLD